MAHAVCVGGLIMNKKETLRVGWGICKWAGNNHFEREELFFNAFLCCARSFCAACGVFSCSMWELVLWPRDRTCTTCIKRQSLNHWTAREVPKRGEFKGDFLYQILYKVRCSLRVSLGTVLRSSAAEPGKKRKRSWMMGSRWWKMCLSHLCYPPNVYYGLY